jgi:NAD(P)-dependent dehydrogenase (short-subunit alcohol dehydrogenase family)
MTVQLKDKVIVITGSTRGFGYSVAEALLKRGATVIVTGRSADALQSAVNSLSRLGPVSGEQLDVRNEAQVHEVVQHLIEKFGRIDIWINNAGFSSSAGMMLDINPQEALDMFLANDLGLFYCAQAVLAHMMPRKSGMLVNMYGNGSFLRPASPTGLYGATKAWLTSFTRSLAKELQGSGIQVLGFSPGMMLTDMLTSPRVVGERGKDLMKRYDFVLRFLAGTPGNAAEKLAQAISTQKKDFAEIQLFKPWTPFLGILRVTWENLTKTGKAPKYELHYEPAYRFDKKSDT